MITPVTDEVVNEQSGVLASHKAHIKAGNLHIIFEFLRNRCYSDRERAVVREYGTNAQDIHNRHGITRPIQVSLPSMLDSFLKIRDFGPALTNDKIGDIFLSYGESDKRNSNLETGSLGLGCKCGFAYGDSFLVNSYRNGTLAVWNAYIDPSKCGMIDLLAETPTTEPDGLEIVIPVKMDDIPLFREKAISVYAYFDILPDIINITDDEKAQIEKLRNPVAAFEGKGWKFTGRGQSLAIMANVAYTLTDKSFTSEEMPSELRTLMSQGMMITFPNGDLEFAISREELQYTERTKKNIVKRLQEIADEITTLAEAKFQGVKTLWDAKLLWRDVFRMDGSLYHVKSLFNKKIMFNGFPVNDTYFFTYAGEIDGIEVSAYTKGRRKVERSSTSRIDVDTRSLVLVNDTGITNGIQNRVIKPLFSGTHSVVYVVKFNNDTAEKEWRDKSGFDGVMTSLKDMPKEKLQDYYGGGDTSGGAYFSPKHSSREFSYVTPQQTYNYGYRRHSMKNSDYWQMETVDLEKDTCVYLEITKFEYKNKDNWYRSPSHLADILAALTKLGITTPKVYGFKTSSATKAVNNPNMVNFWTWLNQTLQAYWENDPKLIQEYFNHKYVKNTLQAAQPELPYLAKVVSNWSSIPANSNLLSFFAKVNELATYDEAKIASLERLFDHTTYRPQGQANYDIVAEHPNLVARYPLLFKTVGEVGTHKLTEPAWNKAYEDYVTMVDMVTP